MGGRQIWLVGIALVGSALAAGAASQRIPVPPSGSDAWKPLTFRRVSRHTQYTPVVVDGRPVVRADSDCAASALVVGVEPDTLATAPLLRWRWKVEEGLDIEDERVRAGDDFAARVYILFRFEPEGASWFERTRRRVGEKLYGQELPGRALNYVWSSRAPRGDAWQNPFAEDARMVSLGPGAADVWRQEEVDVVADFRKQFGTDPPEPLGLAIMTDSDNSCGRATALFSDFHFVSRADASLDGDVTPQRATP
ncbi:MAG: DUF3047 domain-containing protein [Deltaproteobacteria bacterium]|nr:DUF3047 domain-containing protein [Deltaproteobacteria bacterium]